MFSIWFSFSNVEIEGSHAERAAVAAGARDPPLQADDLGDEPIMARQEMWPELSNGSMSLNRSDLGCLHNS